MSERKTCKVLLTLGLSLFSALAVAQQPRVKLTPPVVTHYDPSILKGMKWRLIGPFRGGRVLAVAGIPGDPYTFYFGGVAGGVWRTNDGGVSWTALTDKEPFASIGSVAVAESNSNILYVGTGEACIRGNISYGNGVYKSVDSGKTWSFIGLKETQHIAKVLVNPKNPDLVYVAALGHAYGPNPERGVFRSSDGGKTWDKVLFKDDKTGAIDLAFDPKNPNVMFAAMYDVQRTPWSLSSGGPGSGLYRSTDAGKTWTQLQGNGLPTGILGRIGVSVSGGDSKRVYALIEAKEGGLFRSDDGGDRWIRINDDQRLTQRAWYFTHIFADPKSVDTVYILNTGLFRSTDGGKSLTLLPAPHGDHHGLWIDPTNPQRMINGNDGGATVSVDGGQNWSSEYNQPTAQFYHVAADNRFLYYLYGAQQDNTTVAIASRTDQGYIGRQDWYDVGGGESGYILPDPRDPNIVYAGSGGGLITRFQKQTQQVQDITVWPMDETGHGAGDVKYRQAWTDPIALSPHNPDVIYTAAEVVFKTTDHGMSWTAISPDLTRNDKSKQVSSGGPLTKDNTTVEYYDTVFTLAESPLQKDLIWAGTDDGLIQLTKDGGQHWENVTPKEIPQWSLVSMIEASPTEAGKAFVAVDAHKLDDLNPYIFKTLDYGQTWTKISDDLPAGAYVHAVREDPRRKGLLFAGTEVGVFVSWDGGSHWQSLQLNLPTTPIHDLIVKDHDLAVATHGRSFWVLDDISFIEHLRPRYPEMIMLLDNPAPAYRLHWPEQYERRQPVAPNPPAGALFYYSFNTAPASPVTLQILDSEGKVVRSYSNAEKKEAATPPEWPDQEPPQDKLPTEAGLNRFAWDLRYEGPRPLPREVGAEFRNRGPLALPGEYSARLMLGTSPLSSPLEVKLDPRVTVPLAEVRKQFELSLKVRDELSELHKTVDQIRQIREQVDALKGRAGKDARLRPIVVAGEKFDKKATPVEEGLLQVKIKSSEASLNFPVSIDERLHSLFFSLDTSDMPPTKQQYAVFDELSGQAGTMMAQWKQMMDVDLAALNKMMEKVSLPPMTVAPEAKAPSPDENDKMKVGQEPPP